MVTAFFSTRSSGEIKREAENFPVAQQYAVTDCRGSSDLFIIGTCFVTNKNRLLLNEMGNSYQRDDLCNLSHFLVAYKSLFKNSLCTVAFCLHFQTTAFSLQVWSEQERYREISVFTESCKGSLSLQSQPACMDTTCSTGFFQFTVTSGCGRVGLMPIYCHLWTAGSVGSDESRDLWSCAAACRVLLSPLLFGTVGEVNFEE